MDELPFDKKLFNPTRLQLMEELRDSDDENIPFRELKGVLGLTDGNLASHLRALQKVGFVTISKSFVGKRPRTSIAITAQGERNLDALKEWFYHRFLECGP